MLERDFFTRIDRYFRREDTILARVLKSVSPDTGDEYRHGSPKRIAEVLISAPLAVVTLPLLSTLALAKKIEDRGSAFYIQKRIGQGGQLRSVVKIRCMRESADSDMWANLHNASVLGETHDSRNTRLGSFMRRFELEELPQLWQVMMGQLSLVEIRSAPQYVFEYLQEKRPDIVGKWRNAYFDGKPGLFSLNSAVNPSRKDDTKRYLCDAFYAEKANLGLDLFILYRTGMRMFQKLLSLKKNTK